MVYQNVYDYVNQYTPLDTYIKRAKDCNLSNIVNKILANHSDIRDTSDYHAAKDLYLDMTMSCDTQECNNWLKHYISKAIAYGLETQDTKWQVYFLSAYDILNNIGFEDF